MSNCIRRLKITIVGDAMVGKTCLFITNMNNEFPDEFIPTVCDGFVWTMKVDGQYYGLELWDTASQGHYERLRPLSYPNTHCYLLCYSISSRTSFENIKSKWWPEIRHFSKNVPVVLVGTKLDLRIPNCERFVTNAEGQRLRNEIHAHSLVECSAKKKLNMRNIFEEAIRAVETKPKTKQRQRHCMLI